MRSRSVLALVVLGLVVGLTQFARRAPPVTDTGRATVVDGDSLEIGATSIRLFGVDAPEALQICGEDDKPWPCGKAATEKLRELAGTREIACREMDTDSYGRSVAVCNNGTVDLGAEMASAGLALAYRQYSDDYIDEEDVARTERRGLWSSSFTAPWDWRRDDTEPSQRGRASPPAPSAPTDPDCRIKGNINRESERIYHVPGSRNYDDTIIDESRGERWFCTEEEAQREGWRAPR